MSGFDPDWLALREPHDLRARDARLAARFAAAVTAGARRPVRLLDLAAGTGASLRALAPLMNVDQHWTLVDHDTRLLQRQGEEIARWAAQRGWAVVTTRAVPNAQLTVRAPTPRGTQDWTVARRQLDLQHELAALDVGSIDGITTSAFLDLVSSAWLERCVAALRVAPRPLLAVLSVDGVRAWHPTLPEDGALLDAFAQHQSGDKGFGAALGAAAPHRLAALLAADGWCVELAPSPWRVAAQAQDLLRPLLEDTVRAAIEARPEDARVFHRWAAERGRQIQSGALTLTVGHLDLLALPPGHDEPRAP